MRICMLIMLTFAVVGACFAQVPIVGANDATLGDVAGTETLVTVVLKAGDGQVKDANLRIMEIGDTHFAVMSQEGIRYAYLFSAVKEIRVQGGEIKTRPFQVDENRALTEDEKRIIQRAVERAQEIFDTTNKQRLKMIAAELIATEKPDAGRPYLQRLASGNDLQTALYASSALFMTGHEEPDIGVIRDGLRSGNLMLRAYAAQVAGVYKAQELESFLLEMIDDRSSELSAPAAMALAYMGNRDIIPSLLRMIEAHDELKGESAVIALSRLGGEDVVEQMKIMLKDAKGQAIFRMARVLFNLGDPLGKKMLLKEISQVPTHAFTAAIMAAPEGDYEATNYLREFLKRRQDPTPMNVTRRAAAACALIKGGDASGISILQELLHSDKPENKKVVCQQIAVLGRRRLLPLVQSAMEDSDPDIALLGCQAVLSATKADYHQRLIDSPQKALENTLYQLGFKL